MSAKRFVSPGFSAGQDHARGPLLPEAARTTPSRTAAAASPFATHGATRRRRYPSPGAESARQPSPASSLRTTARSPMSLPMRGASVGNVHGMLSELVQLSHSIASHLEHDPAAAAGGEGGSCPSTSAVGGGEVAKLKAREIERIVNRVQTHFKVKLDALERENATLRRQLQAAQQPQPQQGQQQAQQGAGPSGSVRRGIEAQEVALNQLDKTWAGEDGGTDVEQLRRILLAEKRQRLLVEEQTQSLSEQHTKVVSTLERRLKKQEDQLRDLINAVDKNYSYGSNGGGSSGGTEPAGSRSPGSPRSAGQMTPRRLLRQQLVQHQQTQRALQQYREHLAPEPTAAPQLPGDDEGDGADDYLDSLGLGDVKATLQAIQRSTPPTVAIIAQREALATEGGATSKAAPKLSSSPGAQLRPSERSNDAGTVEDIGAYLDSITKELETLSGDDDFS